MQQASQVGYAIATAVSCFKQVRFADQAAHQQQVCLKPASVYVYVV